MKLKSLFVTLGLSLALGTSALLPAFSASKETKVANAAYSTDDLTRVTAENSSSFVGCTAYVIGSNTTYGLTSSGGFGKSGDLLALTIESASGSSLVIKRNDNGKYLNNPCSGSWSDSSVTRYINSSNGGLSQDTDASHYWWAVKFPGESTVYYENHNSGSMGTQQSIFYVYAEPAEPTVLSLKVNDGWTADGARFAAYFFGNGETWVDMTLVSGSSRLYEVTAPDGYPSVIFCRMNGATSENNWDNKWNQIRDLTVADGDYFLMDESGDTGDWYAGSDSVYAPCDASEWAESETNKLTWNRLSGQYEIKAYAGLPKDAKFKVHDSTNDAWAGFKGEGMTNDYTLFSGTYEGSDITCLASTAYDIYYKPFANSIWIEENQTIAADHFAITFLDTTNGICVDSSKTAGDTDLDALKAVWNAKESPDGSSLVEKWNALSIGAKGTFAEGTATENITNAYARYVHIMSRYSDALTPFSGGPAYSASSYITLNDALSHNSISIILVVSSITLIALSAVVLLKKRKAN